MSFIKFCFLNLTTSSQEGNFSFLIFVFITLSMKNNFLLSAFDIRLIAVHFFQALPVLQIL